jgi:hypothetical protein
VATTTRTTNCGSEGKRLEVGVVSCVLVVRQGRTKGIWIIVTNISQLPTMEDQRAARCVEIPERSNDTRRAIMARLFLCVGQTYTQTAQTHGFVCMPPVVGGTRALYPWLGTAHTGRLPAYLTVERARGKPEHPQQQQRVPRLPLFALALIQHLPFTVPPPPQPHPLVFLSSQPNRNHA